MPAARAGPVAILLLSLTPPPPRRQRWANRTFNVGVAGGTPPLSYHGVHSTNIAGATNVSYSLANAQFTTEGNYSVVVSNMVGTSQLECSLRVNRYPIARRERDAHPLHLLQRIKRPAILDGSRSSDPMAIPLHTSGLNKALVCRWPLGSSPPPAAGRQPSDWTLW